MASFTALDWQSSGQAPTTLRSRRGWLIGAFLVLYHVNIVRRHVIALGRCAQDHQRAAEYNAAALALFTALLLFRISRWTTFIHYTVICIWTARVVLSTHQSCVSHYGAYTKNALITRLRFDIVHAGLWRTPHEVESSA